MWIYTLLPCVALAGYFNDYKEKNLNHSVSPCDNFYRHVCRENIPREETFILSLQADLERKIEDYLPADYKKLAAALKNVNQVSANSSEQMETEPPLPDEVTMKQYLLHVCHLNGIFPCSFERVGELLLKYNFLYRTASYDALKRFLHKNPSFLFSEENILNFFNLSKKRILQLFKETPWMDQYVGSDKAIIQRLENTVFRKINKTVVDFGPFYREGLQLLERCLSENEKRDVLHYCSGYALAAIITRVSSMTGNDEYMNGIFNSITSFNAGYGDAFTPTPFVVVNPALYGCLYDSWISTLGSLNYGVAHELAHSAFSKYYSHTVPSSSKCFQDHMEGVCKRFFTKNCPSGAKTYGEDGADFVAIKVNLEVLEILHLIDKKKDFQDFFYAAAITWCGDDKIRPGNEHSVGYVRVNGIMRQFPQFAEAFECKPGDYMVQNEEEKCALVGVGAPPRE